MADKLKRVTKANVGPRDNVGGAINNALVTVLNADSQLAQWISSDGSVYSPTSSNIDLTVTADNGTSKESCKTIFECCRNRCHRCS